MGRPRSLALFLVTLATLWNGFAPARALSADVVPQLFTPPSEASRQALGAAEAERLAAYRADRAAAEVTVVRLPTDLLKGTAAVRLNLPATAEIPLDVVSVDQRSATDYSWFAEDAGGGSEATLVVRGGNVVGTIRSGGKLYRLQPLGGAAAALVRIDESKLPPHHPLENGGGPPQRRRGAVDGKQTAGSDTAAADTGAEYTAIVVYTAAASRWSGDIDALIQLAEDETNRSYVNSRVNTRLRIVHKYQTGYTESGSMTTDLGRYQKTSDGYADEVHGKRDQYAADVAILITEAYDFGGYAYIYPEADYAFGVVAVNAISGYIAFQHEIGHIQGARHNPQEDPSTSPFPYGHGYRNDAGGWRTIMAYPCPSVSCPPINYFSNPNVAYSGTLTGNTSVSNNARVLNETAVRVANFRVGGGPPVSGWQPWAGRGGSLASFPECERAGSRIDCWAQGAGGTLAWNRSSDGDTWSSWTNLGGTVASTPECLVRGGRMDCFVTTPAKRMAQITHNGSGWGNWADLGGTVTGRPSCVPGTGLALDCFAIGADKTLHRRQFDGSAWKAWQKLGGAATNRPECVARSGGIDCLVVDGSKNLHTRRLNGSTWAAWKKIGSGFGIVPHCLVSGSKIDCFAQSSGLGLLKGYFNGTQWTTWNTVAGSGSVNTQPYCNRIGSSSDFDCYWTNAAFNLVRRQRSASTWLAEVSLDGAVQQRPVCLPGSGGRIDCLVRGSDNTLQQRTYR